MLNTLKQNYTHLALLHKVVPGTKILEMFKEANGLHGDYVNSLMNDQTKTAATRSLLANRGANVRIDKIFKQIDIEKGQAAALRNHYESTVSNGLTIAGTTDMLIRQQQLAMVQHLKFNEVLSLMRSGCQETAKCLELPLAKAKFGLLTNKGRADSVRVSQEKVLLGDDYQEYQTSLKADVAYETLGDDLMGQHTANENSAAEIAASIVQEVAA
jgi:hypothetical protein